MPTKKLTSFLQFFAEEGGEAPAEPAAAGGDSGVASGEVAGNPAEAGEAVAPSQPEETFESLIGKGGKYHDEYGKRVQEAVNARFKNQRDYQKQINAIDPIVRMAAERYGIKPGEDGSINIKALSDAMSNDKSAYEKEAYERGMSVDDLMKMKQLERENAELRNQNQLSEEELQRQQEWDELVKQGEALKTFYPDFDMETEMKNPSFGRLLATLQSSGFPDALRTAYESVHREEIMAGAMRFGIQKGNQNAANAVKSGSKRPVENGTGSTSAGTSSGIDPSKFTLKDIEEYKKRAARGERITFR